MRKPPIKDPSSVLGAYWDDKEDDIVFYFPNKPDGHWLYGWFTSARMYPGLEFFDKAAKADSVFAMWPGENPDFVDELKARGYDPSTIRFSVQKDPNHPRWKKG